MILFIIVRVVVAVDRPASLHLPLSNVDCFCCSSILPFSARQLRSPYLCHRRRHRCCCHCPPLRCHRRCRCGRHLCCCHRPPCLSLPFSFLLLLPLPFSTFHLLIVVFVPPPAAVFVPPPPAPSPPPPPISTVG
jgi:hypothetical protein